MFTRLLVTVAGLTLVTVACTGDNAERGDDVTTSTVATGAHVLEASDEMRLLAEQQCLDDPELEQGEIRAVDPTNPDEVLAVVTVVCAEVR